MNFLKACLTVFWILSLVRALVSDKSTCRIFSRIKSTLLGAPEYMNCHAFLLFENQYILASAKSIASPPKESAPSVAETTYSPFLQAAAMQTVTAFLSRRPAGLS